MHQFDTSKTIELKRVKHCPKVGDHYLIQNQDTGQVFIRKTHLTTEKHIHQDYQKRYTYRTQNVCPYIIRCYGFNQEIQKDFCSTFYVTHIYYEHPTYDLQQQLQNRIKNHQKYSIGELEFIFNSVLEALIYIELQVQGHG